VTLRRDQAARLRTAMIHRPSLRELGKTAEKWRVLAESRRDDFAQLFRSGRWERYYTLDEFLARAREVAELCDRWAQIVEDYRQYTSEPPEAPAIARDAA
jgi:hypothetical protein